MIKNSKIFIGLLIVLSTLAAKCKEKPEENSPNNYDKKAMLTNVADNYIVPAYLNYKNETSTLNTLLNDFVTTPDAGARVSSLLPPAILPYAISSPTSPTVPIAKLDVDKLKSLASKSTPDWVAVNVNCAVIAPLRG